MPAGIARWPPYRRRWPPCYGYQCVPEGAPQHTGHRSGLGFTWKCLDRHENGRDSTASPPLITDILPLDEAVLEIYYSCRFNGSTHRSDMCGDFPIVGNLRLPKVQVVLG